MSDYPKTQHDLEWIYGERADADWNAQALANTDPHNREWFTIPLAELGRSAGYLVTTEFPADITNPDSVGFFSFTRQKGLPVSVYRNSERGLTSDCTNGGASSRHNSFTLVSWRGEAGFRETFVPTEGGLSEVDENNPAIVVVEKIVFGNRYLHARPLEFFQPGMKPSYMMGGNYIKTSDSRFPHPYPLPIHDRSER